MPEPPALVPAPPLRDWMDAFPDRHAYRCLPLSIANTHGWEILSPCSFEIRWNGGPAAEDIVFRALDDFSWLEHFVVSNFTHGVVTFHTGYMFRTDPGWNLLATGPFNKPKDGIVPMTGVIETDWLPYPFTMNWNLTRAGSVRWEKGEPFCMVFPVPQGALEQIRPEIHDLEDDPQLKAEYEAWRDRRAEFMVKFKAGDEQTLKQAWQRYYFLGKMAGSGEQVPTHSNKIRLDAPIDLRKSRKAAAQNATGKDAPEPAKPDASLSPGRSSLSQLAMEEARESGPRAPSQQTSGPASNPKKRRSGE